ncbi:MAG: SPFH domain-containing protein [Planctomycetota bacterium]
MDIVIRRQPVSLPVLPILTVLILVVGSLITMRVGRIQGNEVGVLVNNLTGNIEVRTDPGALIYNGLITDFWAIDNSLQTIKMVETEGVNIKTVDGADVTLDVEINYRLLQDPVVLRDRVVPECGIGKVTITVGSVDARGRALSRSEVVEAYKAKWMRDFARSIIRYKFGELKTDHFYDASERAQKALESVAEFNRLLNEHGIEVSQVIPDKFHFYSEYEEKIAEKKAADQEAQSQREKARAALEDQARQEAEARAQANVEIEQAKGNLRRDLLAAEAQAKKTVVTADAYLYETKTRADAELFRAKNQARSILAQAEATSQGMRQLATSLSGDGALNLVKLAYAKALAEARISGVPYATSPVVQRVDVGSGAAAATKGGSQ